MPIFEYVCKNCGHRFEKLVFASRRKSAIRCPECGSQEVNKAISAFSSASNSSGQSASGCAPSG